MFTACNVTLQHGLSCHFLYLTCEVLDVYARNGGSKVDLGALGDGERGNDGSRHFEDDIVVYYWSLFFE